MKILKILAYILTPFINLKNTVQNINITSKDIYKDYEIINLNGEELILGKKFPLVWD